MSQESTTIFANELVDIDSGQILHHTLDHSDQRCADHRPDLSRVHPGKPALFKGQIEGVANRLGGINQGAVKIKDNGLFARHTHCKHFTTSADEPINVILLITRGVLGYGPVDR